MKFDETNAYCVRAAHCSNQAGWAQDNILKKFWDDLADDWMALHNTILAVENARIRPSFVSLKDANRV